MSTGLYLQRWITARIDEPTPLVLTVGVSLLWLALRSGVDPDKIRTISETIRRIRVKNLIQSGVPARLRLSPRQVVEKADALVKTARLEPRRLWFVDGWRDRVVRVIRNNDYAEAREVAYAIALETGFDEHIRFLAHYRVPHTRREEYGALEVVGESVALGEGMVPEAKGRVRSLQRLY